MLERRRATEPQEGMFATPLFCDGRREPHMFGKYSVREGKDERGWRNGFTSSASPRMSKTTKTKRASAEGHGGCVEPMWR